jgi:peptidoglycan hydrolase CwlO-like protein
MATTIDRDIQKSPLIEKDLFTSEIRRIDAEIRRLDSDIAGVEKSQEKFETKIEKAVNNLRIDTNAQFDKVDARLDKLNEKIDGNFKSEITIYLTTMGVVLAAFYAFASYMTK